MLLTQPLISTLNHLLRNESWACKKLRDYSGKAVKFTFPLGHLILAIDDHGMVCPFINQPIVVTLTLSQAAIFAFLSSGKSGALKHIRIDGDAHFAEVLSDLIAQLRWEVEEDLAKLIGPIAAHTLVKTARKTHQQGQHLLHSYLENWVEYAVYEQPTLVPHHMLDNFTQQVVTLRDDLARVEKRFEHLQKKSAITSPVSKN